MAVFFVVTMGTNGQFAILVWHRGQKANKSQDILFIPQPNPPNPTRKRVRRTTAWRPGRRSLVSGVEVAIPCERLSRDGGSWVIHKSWTKHEYCVLSPKRGACASACTQLCYTPCSSSVHDSWEGISVPAIRTVLRTIPAMPFINPLRAAVFPRHSPPMLGNGAE